MRAIGINRIGDERVSDEEYIAKIAECGFTGLFSGVFAEERQLRLAELCAAYGIKYEALHAPFGHMNDIWLEGEGGDEMLGELKHGVDHCALAGAGILIVHLSSGETPPSITDIGRARFAELVEYAAGKNVRIAFENQRMLANIAWAFEAFKTDSVGFCWDCGHESCFTPGREYMPLFGDRLILTHIHDNYGIFNDDKHMIPFDASMNFERVAEHIRNSGFEGTVMLELSSTKSPLYADMSVDEYIQRAAKAARRLADMIDGNV